MCIALDPIFDESQPDENQEIQQDIEGPMEEKLDEDGFDDQGLKIIDPKKDTQGKKRKNREKNPYLQYGVAIENFFNLEVQLIKIFCVLTLLAIPQMIVLYTFDYNVQMGGTTFLEKTSFSSMGQANTLCSKAPNQMGEKYFNFIFECDANYEITDAVFSAGLLGVSHSLKINLMKMSTICYLSDQNEARDREFGINTTAIMAEVYKQCLGQNSCLPKVYYDDIMLEGFSSKKILPGTVFFA